MPTRGVSAMLLSAILFAAQLWLFSWAPQHGHALDAALGFLLMPITLVLGGRVILRDEVTGAQWVAVGIAVVAVMVKIALTPQVSWVTFFICIGYPVYFVTRRRAGLDNPMAFGAEVALITPARRRLLHVGGADDRGRLHNLRAPRLGTFRTGV